MKVALIGGGNMGFALVQGMLKSEETNSIQVAEPLESQREKFDELGIATSKSNQEVCVNKEVVILAVKPQVIETVVREISAHIDQALVISIAAGTTLTQLTSWLSESVPIVRAMPNTPALIGEGMTGLIASSTVTSTHRELATQIFNTCGEVQWFENDRQLNIVTALSGSGPAYFFYMLEALIQAGQELGLPHDQCLNLVLQTAVGSTRLAKSGEAEPTELRQRVTSPGGTTEAAMTVLDEQHVKQIFQQAVKAAFDRGEELANN